MVAVHSPLSEFTYGLPLPITTLLLMFGYFINGSGDLPGLDKVLVA